MRTSLKDSFVIFLLIQLCMFHLISADADENSLNVNCSEINFSKENLKINISVSAYVVKFSWSIPIHHKECIEYYEIDIFNNTGVSVYNSIKGANTLSFHLVVGQYTELKHCNSYNFKLRVFGDGVEDMGSFEQSFTTKPVVPGAPTSFNVSNNGPHGLLVKWNHPKNLPYCVNYYQISFFNDYNRGNVSNIAVLPTKHEYKFPDPISCMKYTFLVFSVGEGGKSNPISKSYTTKEKARTAPKLNFKSKTNNSITVKWETPRYESHCTGHYVLNYKPQGPEHINTSRLTTPKIELSQTSYTITNLNPCAKYEIGITVEGEKEKAEGEKITVFTEPEAPSIPDLSFVNKTKNSITIKWEKPIDQLNCPWRYVLDYKSTEEENINTPPKEVDLNQTLHTITDLKPCVKYEIGITAKGETKKSGRNEIKEDTEPEVPGPVESFEVADITSNQINLTWSKPKNLSACKSTFEIRWSKYPGLNETKEIIGHWEYNGSYAIKSLEPCTKYTFSILAVNEGDYYSDVRSNITEQTAAGEVQNLNLTNSTRSLIVTWDKPRENLMTCISQYKLDYAPISQPGSNQIVFIDRNKSSYTMHNLKPCVDYEIGIRTIGTKKDSERVTLSRMVNQEEPGQVQSLKVTNIKSNKISLNWKEPNEFSECVDHYLLSWSTNPRYCSSNGRNYTTSNKGYTIDDLEPCTNYAFSIAALGKENRSIWDERSTISTETGPGEVGNLKVRNITNSSLTVTWDESLHRLSCAVFYELDYSYANNTSLPDLIESDQNSYTIEKLNGNVEYKIGIKTLGTNSCSKKVFVNATIEKKVPGAVKSFKATDITTDHVTLKWTEPTDFPEYISRYEISWSKIPEDSTNEPVYTDSFSDRQYTIDNLEPCTTYRFSISAVGHFGKSNSIYDTITTKEAAPSEVENLYVADTTTTSITVVWGEPLYGLNCAEQYILSYAEFEKNENGNVIPIDINQTYYTINDLNPAVIYKIGIAVVGRKDDSEMVIAVQRTNEKEDTSYTTPLLLVIIFIECIFVVFITYSKTKTQKLFNGKQNWTSFLPMRNNKDNHVNGNELNEISTNQKD